MCSVLLVYDLDLRVSVSASPLKVVWRTSETRQFAAPPVDYRVIGMGNVISCKRKPSTAIVPAT